MVGLVTWSKDPVAPRVAAAIQAAGGRAFCLWTDRYPGDVGLSWQGPGQGWVEAPEQGRVPLGALTAIWWQQERYGRLLAEWQVAPHLRGGIVEEAATVLRGALYDTSAFHLDPLWQRARYPSVAAQAPLAARAGLRCVARLEGNLPSAVAAWVAQAPDGVEARMYAEPTGAPALQITAASVEMLDDLAGCPMVFEEPPPLGRVEVWVGRIGGWSRAIDAEGAEVALPPLVGAAVARYHEALGSLACVTRVGLTPGEEEAAVFYGTELQPSWEAFVPHGAAEALAALLLSPPLPAAPGRV